MSLWIALGSALLLASRSLADDWTFPAGECVSDVKIEPCSSFDCRLPGYHRIDAFLNQAENTTQWNYVFYKTDLVISQSCVTEIKIVPEGQEGPKGSDWYPSPHSALHGITPGGGAQLYSRRKLDDQLAGRVVDLVVIRPGQYTNSSEPFIRERVNLGLGAAAGTAEYIDWSESDAVSSGWVFLEYTLAGPRAPITQVQVKACPPPASAMSCGDDLIEQGWKRRDLNLNGPTANGSTIYLFTSTNATASGDCVGELKVVDKPEQGTINVNLNDGTNGTTLYLNVTRSTHGICLTSIVPIDSSRYFEQPGYKPVLDTSGAPADVNKGVHLADPIYIFTSTLPHPPSYPHPVLSFNSTGGFRVALFSDLHLGNVGGTCLDIPEVFKSNCSEEFTFTFMERALDQVQPDLVVINGDLYIYNDRLIDDGGYPQLTRGALQKAFFPIIERGLPFAVTWGNHDAEGDLLREELQLYLGQQPGFIGSRGLAELDGIGNYKLEIVKSPKEPQVAHKLWFFDSRSYTYFANNGSRTGAYGQVEQSQVDWYKREAVKDVTPGMAFFHIPLPQISGALGLNSSAEFGGVHGEEVCSQGARCTDSPDLKKLKKDLFGAFVAMGDVRATFSGHDHDSDYAITVKNITLTYDGSAGYNAYSAGDPNYNREMRVIDIVNHGASAESFKVIDDIFAGTVHRNTSEPVITLF